MGGGGMSMVNLVTCLFNSFEALNDAFELQFFRASFFQIIKKHLMMLLNYNFFRASFFQLIKEHLMMLLKYNFFQGFLFSTYQ